MRFFFKTDFFTKTQNSILSAAAILAAASALNAVFGLLKGRILTSYFGVSNDLAIFYVADRIPNIIFSVLFVGAISTVFIPIFSGLLKKNEHEAFRAASSMINITFLMFATISTIIFIFSKELMYLLTVNRITEQEALLGSNLMRIMLAAQLILVLGSLASSILQSYKFFLIPSLAPVVYNMGMLGGIVFLSQHYGIYGPAIGVIFGSVLHVLIQIPLLAKTKFKYTKGINITDTTAKDIFYMMPPRIGSVLLANLIGTLNNSFAMLISHQAVVYLKNAAQLQNFPVNLFGLSMASAALPTLSSEAANNDMKTFNKVFITSFLQSMYFIMPLSMILLILRVPAVRIVYGVAEFPWEATIQTAATLGVFSISIFAQSANYLITRAFYALKDTVTPVAVSSITALLSIGISYVLVAKLHFDIWAVALSFSVTTLMDTGILMYMLNRKTQGLTLRSFVIPFGKIAFSTIAMGFALYVPINRLDRVFIDTAYTINLILLTGIAGAAGLLTYFVFTKILNVEEIQLLYKMMRKLKITKEVTVPVAAEEQPL